MTNKMQQLTMKHDRRQLTTGQLLDNCSIKKRYDKLQQNARPKFRKKAQ